MALNLVDYLIVHSPAFLPPSQLSSILKNESGGSLETSDKNTPGEVQRRRNKKKFVVDWSKRRTNSEEESEEKLHVFTWMTTNLWRWVENGVVFPHPFSDIFSSLNFVVVRR